MIIISKLLEGLNKQQQRIVTEVDGKILVISGAGSGKTLSLTHRVAYLLEKGMAQSSNILAVTFTNKAAGEMKERIGQLVDGDNKNWWIGTFHSIAVRMLIRYGSEIGIPKHFSIADDKEQKSLIKKIMENHPRVPYEVEEIMSMIGDAKNNLLTPAMTLLNDDLHQIAPVYEEYAEKLTRMHALDFDDLIMKTVQLLQNSPLARERYQDQFKYILVDEAQDLNRSQLELVNILSQKHGNLCLIGDVDQGVYSWRGADVNIIRKFSSDAKVIKLEQNYRSTQTIVKASNYLIEHNENRLDKVTTTENAIGEKILSYTGDTEYHEAEFVGGIINYYAHIQRSSDYKDFAILYRTNMQSRAIEDELSNLGIRYRIIGGVSFYDRKEVKDTLAYLKLLINPYDVLSFERLINEPKRAIGDGTLKKISEFIYEQNISCIDALSRLDEIPRISKKAKEAALNLQAILNRYLSRLVIEDKPSKFISELMIELGYLDMLDQSDEKDRVLNIYELASMAQRDFDMNETSLEDFVKRVSLISDADTVDKDDNCVQLMTAHISKGLEFDTVFVIGLEENVFPHYITLTSGKEDEMEEERRLFYVAMTRAEKRLYLTNAKSRGLFGKTIKNKSSRFLDEVPAKYKKTVGVRI